MYKYISPVQLSYNSIREIEKQMMKEQENKIYKYIVEMGVNVDKYELIKALNYDRNQYDKGYNDALLILNDLIDKINEIEKNGFVDADELIQIIKNYQ